MTPTPLPLAPIAAVPADAVWRGSGLPPSSNLFRPAAATREDPAPAVLICPGFERSKETMASFSMEPDRRGFAAIAIDPYSQGATSSTTDRSSAKKEGYGLVAMADHVHGRSDAGFSNRAYLLER